MIPLTHTEAPSSRQVSRESPTLRRLDVFVGGWKMEGEQHEGAFGPAANVMGQEIFEWMTGGKFLVHRLEGLLGDARMACIEVIESQPSSQGYRVHTFYNDGRSQVWQLEERDGNWYTTADWPTSDGSMFKVRCVQQFEDGGNTRHGTWQSSRDGETWETFWKVTSTKA